MGNLDWLLKVPGWENQQDLDQYGIPNGARPLAFDNPFRIGTAYSTKMPTWFTAEQQRMAAYRGDAYTTNAQGDQVFAIPYIQGDETNISAASLNPGAPATSAAAATPAGPYDPQIGEALDPARLQGATGSNTFLADYGRDVQSWSTRDKQYILGADGNIERIIDARAQRDADLARRNAEFEGQNNAAIQRTVDMNRSSGEPGPGDPWYKGPHGVPDYWDPNGGNQQFRSSNPG